MYQDLWKNLHRSVCSIKFYSSNGIKLASLTGFKIDNRIATDEYVYKIEKCDEVIFQFVKEDGYSSNLMVKMSFSEFSERVNRLVEYENEGYALIEFDQINSSCIPSMVIDHKRNFCIGQQIAVIGYHIDEDNLSLKNGIIASFFRISEDKRLIQFDAAIKQGNSGSPLIDVATGRIIGIVGYQMVSITKSNEAFKNIIDENLRLLKSSVGKWNIEDIDPIQVLIANQHQLKQISKSLYRSAIMSFGYAHEISSLCNYIEVNDSLLAQSVQK